MSLPDYATVSRLMRYEPDTGKLFWLSRPGNRSWEARFSGREAFTSRHGSGYLCGRLLGRGFLAHRVAWLLAYGRWPTDHIDHIDGDKANNRISNLRDVPPSKNSRNRVLQTNNKSGGVGVLLYKRTGRWMAFITENGTQKHLGYFDTFDAALAARAEAQSVMDFTDRHGKALQPQQSKSLREKERQD